MVKLKLEFDGWLRLSLKQQKEILNIARRNFMNANFVADRTGLLIEDEDEMKMHKFCVDIVNTFKESFVNQDGYSIIRMSRKYVMALADFKRKLSFDAFKDLIQYNEDASIVLAGILYLTQEEVNSAMGIIKNKFDNTELEDRYKILLIYASSKTRPFSII